MKNNLFVLLCLIAASCHSGGTRPETPEVVRYEGPTVASLRPFIKSIEAVKLESCPSVVIGALNVVRQEDSCFYIGDVTGSKLIYRYNSKGHFLDSIGKVGKGPGEYLGIDDFYIDAEADEISVLSNLDSRFSLYHKDGRFIGQKNAPDRSHCFTKIASRLWIYQGVNNGHYPERLIQTDTSMRMLGKYLPLETQTLEPGIGPLLVRHREDAWLFQAFDPVVYRIMQDTVLPALQFDYGKYAVPASYWEKDGIEAFMELSQRGFISMRSFMINDDYIITEQNQQAGINNTELYYICGIKDKRTGKWDWVRQRVANQGMMTNDGQSSAPVHTQRQDWYAHNLKGFTQDGKLMVLLYGYELEYMTPEDKALIQNPEMLEQADPETDMFLFLLTLN